MTSERIPMNPATIAALAAIFGSLVGALGYNYLDHPETSGSARIGGKKDLPLRAAVFGFPIVILRSASDYFFGA